MEGGVWVLREIDMGRGSLFTEVKFWWQIFRCVMCSSWRFGKKRKTRSMCVQQCTCVVGVEKIRVKAARRRS